MKGLKEEYNRTSEIVLQITGEKHLLDNDPSLQRSVQLRNGSIVPSVFYRCLSSSVYVNTTIKLNPV
ncbi:MAG UNVERIFIED_CONTAM: phosphoenolpyruvate carboxylase [Microcystis novacekii LVE1205-3]